MKRFFLIFISLIYFFSIFSETVLAIQCSNLHPSQYSCEKPSIDEDTYELKNCQKNNKVQVSCTVNFGVNCTGSTTFKVEAPCRYTNGKSYSQALAYSIFFGIFGADRFYLGYPAIGLLKLLTGGFFFVGAMIDVCLIALQKLGPQDGSYYIAGYNGPKLNNLEKNNFTYQS
ncbi:beta-amyloid binding protein-related [Anaeramoeba ignava]|uniref:Beta-amyloid binding protein-related n=1 Tax=Anaeramoeba ignava TaxID=1746090 RepID=A0A9Q0R772_ANAIG|nr:beta-amyloid binding protein-related [Anaeramoeba ignava]